MIATSNLIIEVLQCEEYAEAGVSDALQPGDEAPATVMDELAEDPFAQPPSEVLCDENGEIVNVD